MLQKVDQVQYVEGEGGAVQKVWASNFELMMTIMWHPAPVKLVEMILAEMEVKKDEPVESEFEPERKSRRARPNSKKRKQSA
jgi:hypothetical protein